MHPKEIESTGVGVMIFQNGKLLMGRRLGPLGHRDFGWVGGRMESDETDPWDTAVREIREETGLQITANQLIFLFEHIVTIDGHVFRDIEFILQDPDGDPQVMEPDKCESWNWYELNALPEPLFLPCIATIQAYFQWAKQTSPTTKKD